jgi:isoleucyl-tRNA synthetase
LEDWPVVGQDWRAPQFEERYKLFLELRPFILKTLETRRGEGLIGASLEAKVILKTASKRDAEMFKSLADELSMLLIVSQVSVEETPAVIVPVGGVFNQTEVVVQKADGVKCPRCWNYKLDTGVDKDHPDVCGRCAEAVKCIKTDN